MLTTTAMQNDHTDGIRQDLGESWWDLGLQYLEKAGTGTASPYIHRYIDTLLHEHSFLTPLKGGVPWNLEKVVLC